MIKIALVMAMVSEAETIIAKLGLSPVIPDPRYRDFQFQFFAGSFRGMKISLSLPGFDPRFKTDSIGTEPAAVLTFATVMAFAPDLIINAGTCGSFARDGAALSKIYLSESAFYFHDHRIPLPGWDQFGVGNYPSLDVRGLAHRLGFATANISTGNSLAYTDEDLQNIRANGAILKEMEAGAIAWTAFITRVPLFAIKAVTNLLDVAPDSAIEFTKNFAAAIGELNRAVLDIMDELSTLNLGEALREGRI